MTEPSETLQLVQLPRILILGTASTAGESYEVYSVADTSAAEVVFGSDSELIAP